MVVVITGASQGIGRAIAEAFAEEANESAEARARIALLARNEGKLQEVAESCRSRGAEAAVYRCDVTDDDAVFKTARAIEEQWGAADVLVNNAGLFEPAPLLETSPEQFRAQVDVNLTSAFVVTRAFAPAMAERGSGHLFFMASIAALTSYPDGGAYAAAKHGLRGVARTLRAETKGAGLRVTTLLPGATYTASWEGVDLPEERFMPPEDVARAVVDAYRMSDRTVIEEIVMRPQLGDV